MPWSNKVFEVDYVEIEIENGKPEIYVFTKENIYIDKFGNVARNGCKKMHIDNFDLNLSIQPPRNILI